MTATIELSTGELRSLHAYATADPGIPLGQDRRMFERLRKRGLVVGSVAYNSAGEPYGVIKVTPRGREILQQAKMLPP